MNFKEDRNRFVLQDGFFMIYLNVIKDSMILDSEIKLLINRIESSDPQDSDTINLTIKELVLRLKNNLLDPKNKERYELYKNSKGQISEYPIDRDGYALAVDPLENEQKFWDIWNKYGVVVNKYVVSEEACKYAIDRMHEIIREISEGKCDLDKSETWKDTPADQNGISFISRGFFEIYHDKALSDIRQSIRLYIHHVMIWGRVDLWTSFDRLGVKLPGHEESYALPLHVDQNPLIHPEFKTIQGVLALVDCPIERGTFVGVPGSKFVFDQYKRFALEKGEFVELLSSDPIAPTLIKNAQPIPIKAGQLVTWDSRTTHANTENTSNKARYVAYIAAGPAREENSELITVRMEAFQSGIGANVREALMHASKKARYSDYVKLEKVRVPEKLTLLGKLLYGKEHYGNI